MIRLAFFLSCLALPLWAVAAPVPKEQPAAHPYFPAEVGMKWEYTREGAKEVTVVMEIIDVTERDGVKTVVQTAGAPSSPDAIKILYRIEAGTVSCSRIDQVDIAPPRVDLRSAMKSGDTWVNNFRADGKTHRLELLVHEVEKVETPAGAFNALCVRESGGKDGRGRDSTSTMWFATGVGLVKVTDTSAKRPPLVLSKFTTGKEPKK